MVGLKVWSRRDYMGGRCTHDEYYLSIARALGFDGSIFFDPVKCIFTPRDMISEYVLRNSRDAAFNDIPLYKWDFFHPFVQLRASSRGILFWAQNETVCLLKSLAREYIMRLDMEPREGPHELTPDTAKDLLCL